ncbi:MAG: hypothetical protein IPI49_33660 [Myxococcales bacterium]|nr:hypothetical protein [Myxococcales bacterium]
MASYDPNTNRPIVLVDFNRFGSRVFSDLTSQVVGQKVATILDGKVKSAPIINGPIPGGRAAITMVGRGSAAPGARGDGPDKRAQDRLAAGAAQGDLVVQGRRVAGPRRHRGDPRGVLAGGAWCW